MTGPDEQQDRSSLMPILTAVGVVVLVLIAFWISTFFRGDGLTPELRARLGEMKVAPVAAEIPEDTYSSQDITGSVPAT